MFSTIVLHPYFFMYEPCKSSQLELNGALKLKVDSLKLIVISLAAFCTTNSFNFPSKTCESFFLESHIFTHTYIHAYLSAQTQPNGELHLYDASSAMATCHSLAMRAADKHKKTSVVRVTTADLHSFLLQTVTVSCYADSSLFTCT